MIRVVVIEKTAGIDPQSMSACEGHGIRDRACRIGRTVGAVRAPTQDCDRTNSIERDCSRQHELLVSSTETRAAKSDRGFTARKNARRWTHRAATREHLLHD